MSDTVEPVLAVDQYVPPGVYVGEILQPSATNLSANVRVPAIIAKGSPYAIAQNVGIIRAFLYNISLNFTKYPPFIAPLVHAAQGSQALPNQIVDQTGVPLLSSDWQFVPVPNSNPVVYQSVQISDSAYNPNSTYSISYQTTDVSVQDQIPIAQLQNIRAVGTQVNQAQFIEYQSFYVPMSFTDVTNNANNAHNLPWFGAVQSTLEPSSTGSVVVDPTAVYAHNYSRIYTLQCLGSTGVSPNRTATFQWSAALGSGGNGVLPPTPIDSIEAQPQFLLDENVPSSLAQTLELGVLLDFAFGSDNFLTGDQFVVEANGPSLIEIDQRYNNPQYPTINAPVLTEGSVVGNLAVTIDPLANYSNLRNNNYLLNLIAVTGTMPNRQYQFDWARYGDLLSVSGNFIVYENNYLTHVQTLSDGVKLDFAFGLNSPTVGAQWTIAATSARIYYTAKDSRQYQLNVSNTVVTGTNTIVNGGYSTNTTAGGFGIFSDSFTLSNLPGSPDGFTILPDNVSIALRNSPSYAALDQFSFAVADSGLMDWSLDQQITQTFQVTDFQTDQNGSITGQAGLTYIILSNVPTNLNSILVQNYNTQVELSFNFNVGTPFIYFNTNPNVPLLVTYTTAAPAPDPGQTYYVTATFVRPPTYYNTPVLVLRLQDGQNFAAPATTLNDLYTGNQVFWNNGGQAVYLVQPYNQDGSGNYSIPDFTPAIQSLRPYANCSDLCLLNFPQGLSLLLEENVLACDPFQRRMNLIWWGEPIGTPIGDINTPDSLTAVAQISLQVTGNSPSHGTRIMVANTTCTMDVVLDNGLTSTLTLDGSFLALAGASRVASFLDPATDILGTQVTGFDSITVYTTAENNLCGQAQMIYITGSNGVYTWAEDTTVDASSGFNLIQLMTQRMYVTNVVIANMATLIGIVPGSSSAGIALVQGQISSILRGLLGQGLIGQYQDSSGNVRAFDPNTDVIVFQDQTDLTKYYFNYAWFSRNVIKYLLGLYALNSNDFSVGVPLQS